MKNVDQQQFRDAMARLGAAVNIITTDGPGGRYGLTASAVCSVTDDPPTLLACINRDTQGNGILKQNMTLCVNVLSGAHIDVASRFASKNLTIEERFQDVDDWSSLTTGAPVLNSANTAMDCRITDVKEVGTHSVFFCEVVGLALGGHASSLLYVNRAFHTVD